MCGYVQSTAICSGIVFRERKQRSYFKNYSNLFYVGSPVSKHIV